MVSATGGLLALAVGGLGTAVALPLVPVTWSEGAQLAALCVPTGIGALLGLGAALAGIIAAWRAGLRRAAGWIGLFGAAAGAMAVVGAAGWVLFLGGLAALASFAWH